MAEAPGHRILTGALWAGFIALAWTVFTLFFGGGAAHADDREDDGRSGGLTSLLGETVGGLTSLAGDTVRGATAIVAPVVTEVVAPVVTTVVAPVQEAVPEVVTTVTETVESVPVVGQTATPVVSGVGDAVEAVTTPVTEVLQDAPVTQLTDPVTAALEQIPVVGGLLSGLGVTDGVDNLAGALDATVGVVGDVAAGTFPPVLDALDPGTPDTGVPGETTPEPAADAPPADIPEAPASSARTAAPAEASTGQDHFTPVIDAGVGIGPPALPATGAPASPEAPAHTPLGVPTNSSAGFAGGHFSDGARLGDAATDPHRAGLRVSGVTDDVLPPSRSAETDVSPD